MSGIRAKVFLSCGQSKASEEPEITEKVSAKIRELGFECYVAVAAQSLRGIREQIFDHLDSSDYLVFIDFKREKLGKNHFRGSLFSHQELAIASFLNIPALVLKEKGVESGGMLTAFHANAIPFSDREHLASIVEDHLRKRLDSGDWNRESRNALALSIPTTPFVDATRYPEGIRGRYFHIEVRNKHDRKAAVACFAYLEKAEKSFPQNINIHLETIEFKWAGSTLPSVRIGPNSSRRFDAFWFADVVPIGLQFNLFTDSLDFAPRINEPGRYRLTFAVVSENFADARQSFAFEFGKTMDSIRFVEEIG